MVLLIDAGEQCAFAALVMPQIALDGLPQSG
jgi:hypothetical protein